MRRGNLPKEDTLVVRMESILLNQFRQLASDRGESMSHLIRNFIRKEIEDHHPTHDSHQHAQTTS